MRRPARAWLAAAALALACGEPGGGGAGGQDAGDAAPVVADVEGGDARPGAPNARYEIHESLLADLRAERHPSDGGGSVALEPGEGSRGLVAGGTGRFTLVYTAGPEGVAEGGHLFLQVPPFWEWSTPQT
ncbi:MAG: hypothetical protein R3263_05940, partial [Myxococcota bacterium]|nr:hypothetical protein [Myxococcota bacterium]